MVELVDRGIVRSANNPIADIAEQLVADYYGVDPEPANTKGYDVRTPDGTRLQVKGLRLTQKGRSSLSAIRSLEFDAIVAVVFRLDMTVEEALVIPKDVFEDRKGWSSTWKSHRLSLTQTLRKDARVERIPAAAISPRTPSAD